MNVTEAKEFMSHAKNKKEWNAKVQLLKEYHNGALPDFWQAEIIDSQFFEEQRVSWGEGLAQED